MLNFRAKIGQKIKIKKYKNGRGHDVITCLRPFLFLSILDALLSSTQ